MLKKKKHSPRGFTLLELLVVILIIGILAAVALPQYQRTVTNAKAAQMYEAVSTMARVAQSFYIIHDKWPATFEQLDVDYEVTPVDSSICGSGVSDVRRNEDFEFLLGVDQNNNFYQISVRLTRGPYKCTGFSLFLKREDHPDLENKLLCFERTGNAYRGAKNQRGDFCEKVMGYKFYKSSGSGGEYFVK